MSKRGIFPSGTIVSLILLLRSTAAFGQADGAAVEDEVATEVPDVEAVDLDGGEATDGGDAERVEVEGTVDDVDVADLAAMDLEQLLDVEVVTATKTAKSAAEAPAIVSVITREDIARRGYQSTAEVLQHVVGFYLVDDHVLPNAGVRGVAGELFGESGTIKVMIDGHPVAFRSTDGNWLGPELVPLSAIERIEIIRGPSSALYGADAFLGVVNVITRRGADVAGADVRGTALLGSGDTPGLDFDMTTGARKGPVEVMLSVRLHESDRSGLRLPSTSPNPLVPDYRSDQLTSQKAEHASQVGVGKVTYHLNESQSLSLVARAADFDRGSEFSPWTQMPYGLDASGLEHRTLISLWQASVGLIHEANFGESGGLTLRSFYSSGGPTSRDRIDVGSGLYEIRRDFGYETLETQVEGRFKITKGLDAVVGVESSVDRENLPSTLRVLKVGIGDVGAGEVAENLSTRQTSRLITNVGAFGQISWSQLEPFLSLVGGVRYDEHSIYDGQGSARFGAVSNPVDPLFFKVLYGTAFMAPSPLLLFGAPHVLGDVVGNPDLKPQRVHTLEGQISWRPTKSMAISSGLAYSWLLNKAAFVQQGVNRAARNLAEVRTISWETELMARWSCLDGYASFELPHTVRETGQAGYQADLVGSENVIYPRYILRAGLLGRIPSLPLRPGAELIQVGKRRASAMNILENGSSYELPPYALLDATLQTDGLHFVSDELETVVLFKARNLLDAEGPDPGFAGLDYPLLGRSYMIQLRQDF